MKQHIPLPRDLEEIADIFAGAGRKFYLVGGSVRDALMGKTPKDFDVATDANPDQVIEILSKFPQYKLLTVGKSFGVVVVITPEKNEYEIATFRKDIGAGRRPDSVEFTDISTDVKRRDLTINALFYDIQSEEVVDYVGGIEDIKNNVVRTVGDPELRFGEDRLRVLRAFRFAARMGAELDPSTAQAIEKNNSLQGVSPERIRDEFLKGASSAKSVVSFLEMLNDFDMFSQIFPGINVSDFFVETRNVPVLLANLLLENEVEFVARKLNSLKYSADEVSQVSFLLSFSKSTNETPIVRMKKAFDNSKLSPEELLEFARSIGPQKFSQAKKFLDFKLSVSSTELMSQGFKGKDLGDEIARREQENWSLHT